VVIHTIGYENPPLPAQKLLKTIAKENGGQYKMRARRN